jgi:hypothetical protein
MMGMDIRGWVEFCPFPVLDDDQQDWYGVVKVDVLLSGRNRDAWNCLFRPTGPAHFTPLVGLRGWPVDASHEIVQCRAASYELWDPTWITWAELRHMDGEETAPACHSDLVLYQRNMAGELVVQREFGRPATRNPSAFTQTYPELGVLTVPLGMGDYSPEAPHQWEFDGVVYRAEPMRRRDAFDEQWQTLFTLMADLAARYGDQWVRLVAWFVN